MSVLHQTRFFTTVNDLACLPEEYIYLDGKPSIMPEVAFVGRSNAGKSTAINMLCNQKRLAYASNTPGRTQHLNYFQVGKVDLPIGFLVDLPGYGYAAVPDAARRHWGEMLSQYIQSRAPLSGLVVIMDARRPFTELDQQLLDWFAPTAKPVHILLTKADKLGTQEQRRTLNEAQVFIQQRGWPNPITLQLFSSLKRIGIEEATQQVCQWLTPPASTEVVPTAPAE